MEAMETASCLGIDLESGLHELLQSKKKQYPQHVNRISALDEPCLRKLYYSRHDWDKASEIDDGLQGIFETGNTLEPMIERIASEVGQLATPKFRIVGTQTPTRDSLFEKYQISGTIDGFLQVYNGDNWETLGVCDIKTASPNVYPAMNDYESLARYSWTRKYRGQLMLYALAHNLERCFILFVNKSNLFQMKFVEFNVDMGYCDQLLDKAAVVNKAIKLESPPAGIDDLDHCPNCPYYSFCSPSLSTGGNLEIIQNDELEAILERMDELEETNKEYKDLAKIRDELLAKGKDVAVGKWLVTWKTITKNFKAQPAKPARTTIEMRKTIIKG